VILHVTPHFSDLPDDNKGGFYVLEVAKRLLNEKVKVLVAGDYDHAIHDVPKNVVFLDRISDQTELAKYYSMADLALLTSHKETFSMVCAESLACGTPIVGFKAGAPEQIAIKEYSTFVEYGDIDNLTESVKSLLNKDIDKEEISRLAHEVYADEKMIEKNLQIYLK